MTSSRQNSREWGEWGLVANQPDVTEGITEPSLPMNSPRGLVVPDLVCGAVSAGFDSLTHKGVRVIDEDLDSHGRVPARRWADESRVRRFVEKERCLLDP